MKQLALGLNNYSDTHGQLPCGTVVQPSLTPDERLSWLVSILPFLEETTLYEGFDQNAGWASEHNKKPATKPLKMFVCPSQPMQQPRESWPFSSYVGIAGVGADAASLPLEDSRCGVFGYERRVTMEDIKDGTSNTLFILETRLDNGHWAAGGRASVRPIDPEQQPYIGENRPFGMEHRRPFLGSFTFTRVPELANAALLNGSVRTLESTVDPRVLEALTTIAGHEPLSDYDF